MCGCCITYDLSHDIRNVLVISAGPGAGPLQASVPMGEMLRICHWQSQSLVLKYKNLVDLANQRAHASEKRKEVVRDGARIWAQG